MLSDNFTFRADDIVHPCEGECAVQPVVKREGTWSVGPSGTVSLVVSGEYGAAPDRAGSARLPTMLIVDRATGALREAASTSCVYTR